MQPQSIASQPERHLEPCPFCGLALYALWDRKNPKARCRTEGCKGAQLPTLNLDSAEDIAAWNKRALPSNQVESAPDQKPIQLSAEVFAYLKEGVESATQCEQADVDWNFANELLRLMHEPLYTSPAARAAGGAVLAWMHEEHSTLIVSASQKAASERDGGAYESSLRPYSIALGRFAAPRLTAPAIGEAAQAARWRWILPYLEIESDNGEELGRWHTSITLKDGQIDVPGSPYHTLVEQGVDAAMWPHRPPRPSRKRARSLARWIKQKS